MPNEGNIASPCVLIAYGRVGSTLLLDVFRRHHHIQALGETVQLIFNSWLDKEKELNDNGQTISNEQLNFLCGDAVRSTFLRIFHDTRQAWFQKPIGAPNALFYKFGEYKVDDWPLLAEWYWTVMSHSFPDARYFTVLRHPFDIILSAKKKWKTPEERTWRNLGLIAFLLTHPMSKVDYAISYDDLIAKPEETLGQLFTHLNLEFDPQSLNAFSTLHLASPGREIKDGEVPNWKQEWDSLDMSYAAPYFHHIEELFRRYNKPLQLPPHLQTQVIMMQDSEGDFNSEEQIVEDIEKIKWGYITKIHQAMRYGDDLRTYCLDLENRLRKAEDKLIAEEKHSIRVGTVNDQYLIRSKGDKVLSLLDLFDRRVILAGSAEQSAVWNVTIDETDAKAIFLHPPAMIGLTIPDDRPAYLYSAVSLHPHVWDNPQSGGCIFSVNVDDSLHYQIGLNPLLNNEDRGWHEFMLEIPARHLGVHQVIFECRAFDGNNDFRWGLWREPLWMFIDVEDRK